MTLLLLAQNVPAPLPETIVLPGWAQWVILLGTLIAAARMTWLKTIMPLAQVLSLVQNVLPVMEEIAQHFHPNGGASLYDVVTDTQAKVDRLQQSMDNLRTDHDLLDKQVNPPPVAVDRTDLLEELITAAVERAQQKPEEIAS